MTLNTTTNKGEKRTKFEIIEERIDNWGLPTTPADDHKIEQILLQVGWVGVVREALADVKKKSLEPVSKLNCHIIMAKIAEIGLLSTSQSWRPEEFAVTQEQLESVFNPFTQISKWPQKAVDQAQKTLWAEFTTGC